MVKTFKSIILAAGIVCTMFMSGFTSEIMLGTDIIKAADNGIITSGNYQYEVIDATHKYISIVKILDFGEVVEIPYTIDGYIVKEIGKTYEKDNEMGYNIFFSSLETFNNEEVNYEKAKSIIKQLIIPETVERIHPYACPYLNSMTELVLPKSLKGFGNWCFRGDYRLKNLELDDKLYAYAFLGGQVENLKVRGKSSSVVRWFDKINNLYYEGEYDYVEIENEDKGIDNVFLSDGVKKFSQNQFCMPFDRLYVIGKNTKLFDVTIEHPVDNDTYEKIRCGRIFAYKGSKAVKYAKKRKIDYTVIPNPIRIRTQKSKLGKKYVYKWNDEKLSKTICTYKKGKITTKTQNVDGKYAIYKKSKTGEYIKIKTTKKNQWITGTKGKIKIMLEMSHNPLEFK